MLKAEYIRMLIKCLVVAFTLVAVLWIPPTLLAQSDAERFAEAQVAFEKYHDCNAAKAALFTVTNSSRGNPLWVVYVAKSDECLGLIAEALEYYEQYDRLVPGQAEIISKIGDLRYQAKRRLESASAARLSDWASKVGDIFASTRQARTVAEAMQQDLDEALNNIGPVIARHTPTTHLVVSQMITGSGCTVHIEGGWSKSGTTASGGDHLDFWSQWMFDVDLASLDPQSVSIESPPTGYVSNHYFPFIIKTQPGRRFVAKERDNPKEDFRTTTYDTWRFWAASREQLNSGIEIIKDAVQGCAERPALIRLVGPEFDKR